MSHAAVETVDDVEAALSAIEGRGGPGTVASLHVWRTANGKWCASIDSCGSGSQRSVKAAIDAALAHRRLFDKQAAKDSGRTKRSGS